MKKANEEKAKVFDRNSDQLLNCGASGTLIFDLRRILFPSEEKVHHTEKMMAKKWFK